MRKVAILLLIVASAGFVAACTSSDRKPERDSASANTAIGHVALSVSNLAAAIAWYHDVIGLQQKGSVIKIKTATHPLGKVAKTLFGDDVDELNIAQMVDQHGVRLELFEFTEPRPSEPIAKQKVGFLHVGLIRSDIDQVVSRIQSHGGHFIIESPKIGDRRVVFCSDLEGNVIEIANQW